MLQPFLDDSRLKRGDQEILADVLAGQLDDLLASHHTLDPDLQDLFERLNGVTVAEVVQEQMSDAKAAMTEVFGDLGLDMEVPDLRADMSEEEIAATVAAMADRMRSLEEERGSNQRPRRRTKRQLKEEEQAKRFEHLRKIGIGGIYKRLVKALHPDLEPDADAPRTQEPADAGGHDRLLAQRHARPAAPRTGVGWGAITSMRHA